MVELGAEVRERLAEVTSFSSAIPVSLGDNIELWMTYLSQPQPWLREAEVDLHRSLGGRIRQSIAAVIEERTVQASASLAPDWLRRLVLAWHRREAVVITLNYDTLVEKAARDLRVSEKKASCIRQTFVRRISRTSLHVQMPASGAAKFFRHFGCLSCVAQ